MIPVQTGFLARIVLLLCVVISNEAGVALGQQFDIVDLGTLGGTRSWARAITEGGVVSGWATNPSSVKHAVLWEPSIVDLGAPDGFIVSEAVGVNESRQVAGNGEGNPQAYQAYLWENDTWTPLGVLPGRTESIAEDIDSSGRIVGWSFSFGAGNAGGFIWQAGEMTDLGTLGGTTRAHGMNDVGQVVGSSEAIVGDIEAAHRAFLWEDGAMTDLGVLPGEDFSQAFDVNDLGDVVGSSWHLTSPQLFSAHQATLWRAGGAEVIDLGLTPGPEACAVGYPFYTANVARGINNHGQIVGYAQCVASGGPLAAFLWNDGDMQNLNDLIPLGSGWDLLSALDINDTGQIVGIGIAPGGELHAFLLNAISSSVRERPADTKPSRHSVRVQAFPNPFQHGTKVSFVLPRPARVRLTLRDILGRRLNTLMDGYQKAGEHADVWSIDDLALHNGVYLLQLSYDDYSEFVKVTVLR